MDPVRISIMGKEYQIACAPEEISDLHTSAGLVDQRMRALRDAGRIVGADRIAVMVALNLAHELLRQQRDISHVAAMAPDRLRILAESVEKNLQNSATDPANAS